MTADKNCLSDSYSDTAIKQKYTERIMGNLFLAKNSRGHSLSNLKSGRIFVIFKIRIKQEK